MSHQQGAHFLSKLQSECPGLAPAGLYLLGHDNVCFLSKCNWNLLPKNVKFRGNTHMIQWYLHIFYLNLKSHTLWVSIYTSYTARLVNILSKKIENKRYEKKTMFLISVIWSVQNMQEVLPVITVFLTARREALLDFFCSFSLKGIIFSQFQPLNQLPGESRQTHFIKLNIQ